MTRSGSVAQPGRGRRVVVTGASTGIGRATVSAVVAAGFEVIATVRKQADADSLAGEFGAAVRPLLMDLTDEQSVRAAGAEVASGGPLHGLVNNAGAALTGPLEYLPVDTFRRQLEINLVGQLLVTQVMLPALRQAAEEAGDARIVMIGSIGGRIAAPIMGSYQAAKHGLVGLTGALRAELAPSRIKVCLIEPGAIATPIWSTGTSAIEELLADNPEAYARYAAQIEGAREMGRRGATRGLDPSVPAAVVLSALTDANPKPRRTVGRDAAILGTMVRILPFRVMYRILAARR